MTHLGCYSVDETTTTEKDGAVCTDCRVKGEAQGYTTPELPPPGPGVEKAAYINQPTAMNVTFKATLHRYSVSQ